MSLITLLADFPNYSARKVRRLAKQLAALEKACDPSLLPEQRGIAADLMEFNLLQARTEDRLNDDLGKDGLVKDPWWGEIAHPQDLQEAITEIAEMREDWVKLTKACGFENFKDPDTIIDKVRSMRATVERPTERVCVTPLAEGIRAIEEFDKFTGLADQIARSKGIVCSSSFYTDRHIVREEKPA